MVAEKFGVSSRHSLTPLENSLSRPFLIESVLDQPREFFRFHGPVPETEAGTSHRQPREWSDWCSRCRAHARKCRTLQVETG